MEYEAKLGPICNVYIRMSDLMLIKKENKWIDLINSLEDKIQVLIFDDIPIQNEELYEFKAFYLLTYYYWICKKVDDVRIVVRDENFRTYLFSKVNYFTLS